MTIGSVWATVRRKSLIAESISGTTEQTIVASIDQQVLRFTVSYRYYHEFSAPQTIKNADLDHFDYLNATLRFPAKVLPFVQSDDFELYVAYTTGQLPFDQSSDKAFEVGFSTNFQWVADMLAQ